MRRLRTTRGLDRLIANAAGPPPAALDIYRAIRESGGPAERLEQEIRRYRPTFIVNQTRTLPDLKLGGFDVDGGAPAAGSLASTTSATSSPTRRSGWRRAAGAR